MTTSTGKPRGRPKGCAKTGGRLPGGKSLDRGERMLVTAQMAGDILSVYQRLGGADFLWRWAKENQTAFVSNVLQKLMPAAPKDDDVGNTYNTQINNYADERGAALRVAFALSSALHSDPSVVDATPGQTYESVPRWRPPSDMPELTEAEAFGADQGQPLPQPTRTPGFTFDENDPRDYDTQYRAWLLVRDTKESTIETYRGGSGSSEQGGSGRGQPQVITRRASAREIMNRRNSLL